ncbi:hypothetical protein PROFUN_11272 [Planoprotostelium fungivorum]|uniref:Restriction endonuclease type IV Mrr domain-containing protein n=1 Tax=Planoprotostelium fungivorum TaxID=1890364 RepID=A0A2P6NAI0_9EUKA|nr:hypothetical protein PROFUN_11272 [Planoprotostelium fungivorum]
MFSRRKIIADVLTKAKGDALEKRVVRLYKNLGKRNVKRDVTLIDRFGNRSQIDVTYGYFFKTYVECKNYTSTVPLSDVAKFKEVLSLNNIPVSRGIFITTSDYVPRAVTIGIHTVNGEELRELERQAKHRKATDLALWFLFAGGIVGGGYLYVMQHPNDLVEDAQQKARNIVDPECWKSAYSKTQRKILGLYKEAKRDNKAYICVNANGEKKSFSHGEISAMIMSECLNTDTSDN